MCVLLKQYRGSNSSTICNCKWFFPPFSNLWFLLQIDGGKRTSVYASVKNCLNEKRQHENDIDSPRPYEIDVDSKSYFFFHVNYNHTN